MKKQLTLGSLFDGSGGFPLGGILAGITPVWASEIEPFAVRVTTKRLPFIKHLGNVTEINGGEIPPVDIITFGSPCQDLSLAGRREGLQGSRSSLFFEAIRIVKEMREKTNGEYPRFIVWENVFGAFSSNRGEDFKTVLEAIIGVCQNTTLPMPEKGRWAYADIFMGDGWSVAYRTLDAQYWGVPQRRKRIFLVADFRGSSAGDILFKSEGLSGYSAESFNSWQKAAGNIASSIGEAGCDVNDMLLFENHGQDARYTGPHKVSQTVVSTFENYSTNTPYVLENEPKLLKIRGGCEGGGKGALVQTNKSATLGCNNDQTLFEPVAYGICSDKSNSMLSGNPDSGVYITDTARTLDGNGGNPGCNQGGIAVVENYGFYPQMKAESMSLQKEKANCLVNGTNPGWQNGVLTVAVEGNGSRPSHKGDGFKESDKMYTLNTVEQHSIAYGIARGAFCAGYNSDYSFSIEKEVEPTMMASGPSAVCGPIFSSSKASYFTSAEKEKANTLVATDFKDPPLINESKGTDYVVRRLTPTECAKLQGFPEWWCRGLDGKPTDEEVLFFTDVFETYRKVMGTSSKPKTEKQIKKWLENPHTDSAEYKLWGNGVALPCVYFVLAGIAYYA